MTDKFIEMLREMDAKLRARSICPHCGNPRDGLTWTKPNGEPDVDGNGLCRCLKGNCKECTKCHAVKRVEEFPKVPKVKSGRGSTCRTCMALKCKIWRHKVGYHAMRKQSRKISRRTPDRSVTV